ncbi:M48 family metallopeptidase [Prescottella agglutinans]|uniref:M48 metallopeptidase family protein n=1 Tax=Prescottella agglutinans TaxID=1644129 RepID=UPI0024772B56|nr:M48 family metallopeptidase [Prescottella agglutinans]
MTGTGISDSGRPEVEIRRSARRRRTVSARREGDKVVVLMPTGLSKAAEADLVAEMIGKLERADRRAAARAERSDVELAERAARLSARWLGGAAVPVSVRWVPSMRTRWASCTPHDGTIRVSELLQTVPSYVLDYVLVHELVHLYVAGGHNDRFWREVRRYPKTERAMGYLEAYSVVTRQPGLLDGIDLADPMLDAAGCGAADDVGVPTA